MSPETPPTTAQALAPISSQGILDPADQRAGNEGEELVSGGIGNTVIQYGEHLLEDRSQAASVAVCVAPLAQGGGQEGLSEVLAAQHVAVESRVRVDRAALVTRCASGGPGAALRSAHLRHRRDIDVSQL